MAKTMAHKLLIFCWLVVVIIGTSTGTNTTATTTSSPPTTANTTSPTTANTISPTTANTTSSPPTTANTTSPTTANTISPTTANTTSSPPTTANTTSPTTANTISPTTANTTSSPPTTANTTSSPPTTANTTSPTTANTTSPTTANTTSPTTAAPTEPTTAAPTEPTTAAPTEPPTDPCSSTPCEGGSTCEARANGTFICLCLSGRYYNNVQKRCQLAKVFPAVITIIEDCKDGYEDKTSQVFMEKAEDILSKITPTLHAVDPINYINSTVLELTCATTKRTKSVEATVESIFKITSTITTERVDTLIEEIVTNVTLFGSVASYEPKNMCNETASPACDDQTTTCTNKDGVATCLCKSGYIKTDHSDSLCLACPSGRKEDGGICVGCDFGYSGLNCEENWELLLVIVGSGLGGVLLITFIILPIVARKPSKKTSKKSADTGYESTSELKKVAKEPFVNDVKAPAGAVPGRIPRASANNGWDRGTNLEMTPSNSRQNLVSTRIYEDADERRSPYNGNGSQINPYAPGRGQTNPYAPGRGQTNPYAPNRAQTNPYGQNQAQSNPYAQSRGQTNPYYTHDDGRRLN